MIIPCDKIVSCLDEQLHQQVLQLKKQHISPKLVTILLGQQPEQLSFVNIKKRKAEKIGIDFEFIHLSSVPAFHDFLFELEKKVQHPSTTGVIIQHPLPSNYDFQKLYSIIPSSKEIESHLTNSFFQFPLSLAVLSGIKYIYSKDKTPIHAIVDFHNDISFFQNVLHDKNIVIAGKGPTGGGPISKAIEEIGVPYTRIDSRTQNSSEIFQNADIIITATGKKIINAQNIKPGVILLNVGLRKEHGLLKGDFDEEEIRLKAAWYNITPKGLGPLDVSYLYKNLLQSAHTHSIK
ncbi:MAG: Bifunctional protein FolD [Candidatus Roizmanbacteria bacterium GW2011_GWA2_37_7]|uniref:Bifunctional protein FolD n=1 Tax=Candidatus Roizmanbacteria bacterium GW2011_GWA2_37_7 TaxID=1618481 RepID=A0A0G0HJ73_9BACT|nr:MAG: Bifunctional protein FolD [Candidatus Roizmanbacteria bacterium GW2011_GWA2_37_7]